MIRTLHEGLLADGIAVPLTKLCAWFGVPRRTVYYKLTKAPPKVDPAFAEPIASPVEDMLIEAFVAEPAFEARDVRVLPIGDGGSAVGPVNLQCKGRSEERVQTEIALW
ncbi:MAG: hypothetical protein AAFY66_12605 [Pseudomonadota bacterium]